MNRLVSGLVFSLVLGVALVAQTKTSGGGATGGGTTIPTGITLHAGDCDATFQANVPSTGKQSSQMNGIASLINHTYAPGVNLANAPSTVLNQEHLMSRFDDLRNEFSQRRSKMTMTQLDDSTVQMVILPQDSEWNVGTVMTYHMSPPCNIDITFSATIMDASQFGPPGSPVTFMNASYLSPVASVLMNMLCQPDANSPSQWCALNVPPTIPHWNQGGTYLYLNAPTIDTSQSGANSIYNLVSYPWPRFTTPFYCVQSRNNMVLNYMWDQSDRIGMTQFQFNLKKDPANPKPAMDWQFRLPIVTSGETYTYRMRATWGPQTNFPDQCWAEQQAWQP